MSEFSRNDIIEILKDDSNNDWLFEMANIKKIKYIPNVSNTLSLPAFLAFFIASSGLLLLINLSIFLLAYHKYILLKNIPDNTIDRTAYIINITGWNNTNTPAINNPGIPIIYNFLYIK